LPEEEIVDCSEYIDEINSKVLNFIKLSRGTYKKNAHWASQLIPMCDIQVLFGWLGFEETNPSRPTDMLRFETGNDVESSVVDRVKIARCFVAGGKTAPRITIHPKSLHFPITGKIDLLIEDFETSEIVPLEVKTTKDFGEKWEDKEVWKKYLPKREHQGQLLTYTTDMNLRLGTTHGYLWYYNKNRHYEGLYRIPLKSKKSQEIMNEGIAKCSYIEDVLFDRVPFPEFPCKKCDPDKFPCAWLAGDGAIEGQCRFHDWCWERKDEALGLIEKPKNLME